MLLVCILSYLKHFINPCKGNFLRREFWVFYIFCIYLIVTDWKNKTPPYAFFPSLCLLAEMTGPNPRRRQFGLNYGDLQEGSWCPHWCPAVPLQGRNLWNRQSGEVQVFLGGVTSSLLPIFQLYWITSVVLQTVVQTSLMSFRRAACMRQILLQKTEERKL